MMTVLDRDPCTGDKRERVPATRLWLPRRVLVTPGALGWEHGRAMVRRAAALGCEVVELRSDRLPSLTDDSPRQLYREAKSTLAVIVASPSRRRPQPIPPSADWRFDLAQGCPAHCHYCYLAGSLKGPPVTRVYANLPEILAELLALVGAGTVTSRSSARGGEGTTFEVSCYTDPLGIEHLTGSLAATVRHFGVWQAPVQLRLTTKFDAVDPLQGIEHNRRTRVRFSVNAAPLSRRLEGGTAPLPARLAAMRRLALAGYPVGLTVAPIMPVDGWREAYDALFADAAAALADVPALDLTAEFITHRFTSTSREVLLDWYPGSPLEMDEAARVRKTTRFGSTKHVYPAATMRELRGFLEEALARRLPSARLLYWT
jgi:spore photoproduct lyase